MERARYADIKIKVTENWGKDEKSLDESINSGDYMQ